VAFVFGINPQAALEGFPTAGLFRYSHVTKNMTPVVIPGVTVAPGFGPLRSTWQHASMNNSGDIAFPGVVQTNAGTTAHFGQGIFLADRHDRISKVVAPGDPAPGGHVFDFTFDPWLNDGGDIAFGGHIKGDTCISLAGLPTPPFCALSTYIKHGSGLIESVAHQGDPTPGGGTFQWAWGPVMNNRGDVVFMGELVAATSRGIYLHSHGTTVPIARPGDAMPGGGHIQTVNPAQVVGNYSINSRGDITFIAALDTGDSGLYIHSGDTIGVVARTGTVIPGIGTIASLTLFINGGALNDNGDIALFATLTDGSGVLLVASRRP
jgi:hypothetical protein